MPNIRSMDMILLDNLFAMHGGYVLDFSDRTIAQFFAEELNIDFDDPTYRRNGTSKARRLRCFLQTVDKSTAVRTLKALWEYREAKRMQAGYEKTIKNAQGQFMALIDRIEGAGAAKTSTDGSPSPAFDRALYPRLQHNLEGLVSLAPQQRGYAFETFLKDLFNSFGLEAREAFRLKGEQIDGSFVLGNELYLVEAKWQNTKARAEDLHIFWGKIEQKAGWTRGLFISYIGFSEDGLYAFGRGKRVICMDGYDLSEAFMREIPLNRILEQKVRRAGETGKVFVRVRDLFPGA
jgi:Restriction endonuclease